MSDPEANATSNVTTSGTDTRAEEPGSNGTGGSGGGSRLYLGLWIGCLLLLLVDLAYHKHVHYPIEGWFGFFGIYGFLSCVLLALAAKGFRAILMRDEDYYD